MGQPIIVEYDPQWPIVFAHEQKVLAQVLADRVIALEHIGSTSVPGLAAKPIVDVMAGLRQLSDADTCLELLQSLGYVYVQAAEDVMPENRYLEKWVLGEEVIHLHLTEYGNFRWQTRLLFRDYLRTHHQEATQYAQLKRDLAAQYLSGGPYSVAKNEFIQSVVAIALAG